MTNLSINQAKQIDGSFNINKEKSAVVQMWTASEEDYGFGYKTAKLTNLNSKLYPHLYQLWLDGEPSEIWYGIYESGETVKLEETHFHE